MDKNHLFDSETGRIVTLWNKKPLAKKTIFEKAQDLIELGDGTKGTIAVYCTGNKSKISKKGKESVFTTLLDRSNEFEIKSKGFVCIDNHFTEVNFSFQKGCAYLMYVEVNNEYPGQIRIIKIKEVK